MSSQGIVLADFVPREVPNYVEEEVFFEGSVAEYELWFANGPKRHANWVIQHTFGSRRRVMPGQTIDEARTLKVVKQFVCDHAGKPVHRNKSINSDGIPNKKRRVTNPSIKVGCTARIRYKEMLNGRVYVTYSWAHTNHNPVDLHDYAGYKLPPEGKDWIKEHVDNDMDSVTIKSLLHLDNKTSENTEINVDPKGVLPSTLINHKAVQNLIYKRLEQSRKNELENRDVENMIKSLRDESYQTFVYSNQEDGHLIIGWLSPWQKKLLESSNEWCLVLTPTTCKSFINKYTVCELVTIMVRNATNRGIPVAWFTTSIVSDFALIKCLSWLRDNNDLQVKKIMIDGSPTENLAIKNVFGDSVGISVCNWHIEKTWGSQIEQLLEATNDKEHMKTVFRTELNVLMYAETKDVFYTNWSLFKKNYEGSHGSFVNYVETTWFPKRADWVKAWRVDTSFHTTNDMVNSYCVKLKLLHPRVTKVTRLRTMIFNLSRGMELEFRQNNLFDYNVLSNLTSRCRQSVYL
ncbi:uncharacterized protein EV154DRAFT_512053 [Mucor mucedo]|uniref:uncharacterized protein n=1 Tax=Mucor mucedo TaxID=29922 RepID=UPI00221E617A|nr:uncharacterized protein EV154DRAFT_512053 [Mucor mucedo]KAI7890277.1 hypothetical protein EV154DRAFT_512053 [Mucor mucedo]